MLLPDEIMGDSSLLAQMNGVCADTGGSVVGLKRVPADEVSAYGVIDPSGPLDGDGVVPIRDLVEKPPVDEAPSDLIIIGRYVLTPDVFDEIDALVPGRGGELQLTDALRAQAARSPFHGVVSGIERFDTGTPLGLLTAAIELTLRDEHLGPELQAYLDAPLIRDGRRGQRRRERPDWSRTRPWSSTSNSSVSWVSLRQRRHRRSPTRV